MPRRTRSAASRAGGAARRWCRRGGCERSDGDAARRRGRRARCRAARRGRWRRCRRPGSTAAARRRPRRKRWIGTATETISSPRSLTRTTLAGAAGERRWRLRDSPCRWRRRAPCRRGRSLRCSQTVDGLPDAVEQRRLAGGGRRQVEAQDLAARIEVAASRRSACRRDRRCARGVRVGEIRRRRIGATRSGLIGEIELVELVERRDALRRPAGRAACRGRW